MEQPANFKSNFQKKNQDDSATEKISHIAENIEANAQRSRRVSFLRMWVIPFLFALVFIIAVMIGHDLFVKNTYLKNMEKVGQEISKFKSENNHPPSRDSFLEFKIFSRNLSIENINYDEKYILDDSPTETILAYTPISNFRIMNNGHAVLYLDDGVKWVNPDTVQLQIKKRNQLYNSRIIK